MVVAGPSGAGKSRLAAHLQDRYAWPIVCLDDFYRDGDDPSLPILPMGVPDWDSPRSWHGDAAVRALVALCQHGVVDLPTYDISASRTVGHSTVTAEPGIRSIPIRVMPPEIGPVKTSSATSQSK